MKLPPQLTRLSQLRLLQRGRRFRPVDGNSFTLLVGGEAFYEDLGRAIAAAQHEVLLMTYLWADDEVGRSFLEAASDAARRGLRVYVLVDGVGSFGLAEQQLQALRDAGAHAAVYGPVHRWLSRWWRLHRLLRRNHRKNCVIDGRLAWTGGAGIANEWTTKGEKHWFDLMAVVQGPIAAQFREVFADDWHWTTQQRLPPLQPGATAEGESARRHAAPAPAAPLPALRGRGDEVPGVGARERMCLLVTSLAHRELVSELHAAVHAAQRRIWIASAYFVPSFLMQRQLRAAALRGVDVRLVLPGPDTDHRMVWFAGRRRYGRLLAAGVRIFEYREGLQHAKYALIDDTWGFIGSSNLDNWSARFNLELDLELSSVGSLAQLDDQFMADQGLAHEITHARWRDRSLALRLAEQLFGWVDPLL